MAGTIPSTVVGVGGGADAQTAAVQDQLKEYNYYYRQKEYNVAGICGIPSVDDFTGVPEIGGVFDEPHSAADQSDQPHQCVRFGEPGRFDEPVGDSRGSGDEDEQGGGAGVGEGGICGEHVLLAGGCGEVGTSEDADG